MNSFQNTLFYYFFKINFTHFFTKSFFTVLFQSFWSRAPKPATRPLGSGVDLPIKSFGDIERMPRMWCRGRAFLRRCFYLRGTVTSKCSGRIDPRQENVSRRNRGKRLKISPSLHFSSPLAQTRIETLELATDNFWYPLKVFKKVLTFFFFLILQNC